MLFIVHSLNNQNKLSYDMSKFSGFYFYLVGIPETDLVGVLSWVLLNVIDAECEVVLKHESDAGNLSLSCRLHMVFCWSVIRQGLLGLGNGLIMMPGDTNPSALPIAADATVGACQNCSVLHQVKLTFCSSSNFSFVIFCDKQISQQFAFSCLFTESEWIYFVTVGTETEDSRFRVSVDINFVIVTELQTKCIYVCFLHSYVWLYLSLLCDMWIACFNATKNDSCSDSIRQQQTLEELQIRLKTLEKKTSDYESLQAELEEKKVHF